MPESEGQIELILIPLVGLAIAFHELGIWQPVPGFDLFGFLVTGISLSPIFLKAFDNLLLGRLCMEVPLLAGLAMALGTKQASTALWIVCLVLAGKVLEKFIVGCGRKVTDEMRAWLPATAGVRGPQGVRTVSLSALRAGDIVLVNSGGRIPVDGDVIEGCSLVDERLVTGQLQSVEKRPGSRVLAGTTNQSGLLEISTIAVGRDTFFESMVTALAQAEDGSAPLQTTAEETASYLVYAVLASAALTLAISGSLQSTISVLVVAGTAGITCGVPLAHFGAVTRVATSAQTNVCYQTIVMANLAGTITVTVAGVTLAAAGHIHPEAAAAIRVGSELLFLLNAARLLKRPVWGAIP